MDKEIASGNSRLHAIANLIRWDRPAGTWLLFWPCSWGLLLAAAQMPEVSLLKLLHLLALFFLGAFCMRSAGCIINDLWDRKIDAQVERTRNRPLASGAMTVPQAMTVLVALLLASLLIVLQMPLQVFVLALLSLPLVITYPLMKRLTWWPQAVLGLTFNFGALMGWIALLPSLELPAVLLYAAGFFWTLGYDTIYAFQDIADDTRLGIKSTARRLQQHPRAAITVFYGLCLICHLVALLAAGSPALVMVPWLLPAFLLTRQIQQFQPHNTNRCGQLFAAHTGIGFALLLPILIYFIVTALFPLTL